jgi:outer membrane murein-binding lipoprotein Lpp
MVPLLSLVDVGFRLRSGEVVGFLKTDRSVLGVSAFGAARCASSHAPFDKLRARVDKLRARVDKLRARVDKLRARSMSPSAVAAVTWRTA